VSPVGANKQRKRKHNERERVSVGKKGEINRIRNATGTSLEFVFDGPRKEPSSHFGL